MLKRLILLIIVTQLVFSCGVLQPTLPVTEKELIQNQRATGAVLALQQLDEIDTLIKLDNNHLADQISSTLEAQASASGNHYFRKLKIDFDKQLITLEAQVDIADNTGNVISATTNGDILLDVSSNQLEWFPRFNQLQVNSVEFEFDGERYPLSVPELDQALLDRLNTEITNTLMVNDKNVIPLHATPLGEVEVGATLPDFGGLSAQNSKTLNGVFIVAGSAILIESKVTSVALDLEFIPDLSVCPAEIRVTRSVFASDIVSREPVRLARSLDSSKNLKYFYSEISGVQRPMNIIHYWFANGQPVVVEELPVGPSTRWRTWSAKGRQRPGVTHWEVLVVEKESGCIMHSKSIRTLESERSENADDPATSTVTFNDLRNAFNTRSSDFPISSQSPDVALIETKRPFLRDVLTSSLTDLYIETEFAQDTQPSLNFSTKLALFDDKDIVCEHSNCPPPHLCTVSPGQCKRIRDTRDCSSCLFRNPLNNRCVSQAIDPICDAARSRQNTKYDADRARCIANMESRRSTCEQLEEQLSRSCEIDSGFEKSACEFVKFSISELEPGVTLAHANADTKILGKLGIVFSNFKIEGDFARMQLDVALKSNLELGGDLEFSQGDVPQLLLECISDWSAPFFSRATPSTTVNSMLATMTTGNNALTASWSGFVLPLTVDPTPLASMFAENPHLLATCGIGLKIDQVEQALSGADAAFFAGQLQLEIQPQPARILLAPATVVIGGKLFQAEARLSDQHLRYDIRE